MSKSAPITIGYNGEIQSFTLSPLRVRSRGGVTRWMYSSLFRYDEDGDLVGDLVDNWVVSPDRKTYVLTLKGGVRWHDGHPFRASDVVFTAERLMEAGRAFRNSLYSHGEPARFTDIGELMVRIDLAGPQGNFLHYLTPVWGSLFLVVPEHALGDGEDAFETSPIGTGPFRWGGQPDERTLRLLANEDYFGGAPKAPYLDIRFYPQNEERVEAFQRGELDILVFPGRRYSSDDARSAGATLYSTPTNTIVHLAMNCRHPLFESVRTRQAIAMAIDRERLVRDIEGPDGIVAYSPVGPVSWGFTDDVPKHPHDPERAKELLGLEGWAPGQDGVLARRGERFTFSIMFPPDTWNYELATWAESIAGYLKAIGIEARPTPVDYWTTLKTAWREQDFESFIYYDTFYVEPDLYWAFHSSMPRRPVTDDPPSRLPQYGYGVTGYANPRVDHLIEEYREQIDPASRRAIVGRIQHILAEEVASLWLYNHQWKNVVRDGLGGLSRPGISDGTSDLVVLLHPERLEKST
ncbi:MAG TPA: ABC transporter substrate-binding protein [Acidimicrobiia bacterium]